MSVPHVVEHARGAGNERSRSKTLMPVLCSFQKGHRPFHDQFRLAEAAYAVLT